MSISATTIPVNTDVWYAVIMTDTTLTFTNPSTIVAGDLDVFSGSPIVNPSNYNQVRGTVNLDSTGQSQLTDLENGLSTMSTNTNLDGVILGTDISNLGPDSYNYTGPAVLSGTFTLTGTSSDYFYFQMQSSFTIDDNAIINIQSGIDTNNIFWYVAGALNIGSNTTLVGNFLTPNSIEPTGSTGLTGRFLSTSNAISIPSGDVNNNNCIYEGTKILIYDIEQNKEIEKNIEDLNLGDLIVTNGIIIEEKKFIQMKNKYTKLNFIYGGHMGYPPICIKKGAMNKLYPQFYEDKEYPNEDLYVSINHGLLIPTKENSSYYTLIRVTNFLTNIKLIENQEKWIFLDNEKKLNVYHLGFINSHTGIYTNALMTESLQLNS
jgi:hypothetical protein